MNTMKGVGKMIKTIKSLKEEITKKQREQCECISEQGFIQDSSTWNRLMREISELHTAVEWIERMVDNRE